MIPENLKLHGITKSELLKYIDIPKDVCFYIDPIYDALHFGNLPIIRTAKSLSKLGCRLHCIFNTVDMNLKCMRTEAIRNTNPLREEIKKCIDGDIKFYLNHVFLQDLGLQKLLEYLVVLPVDILLSRQDILSKVDKKERIFCNDLMSPLIKGLSSNHVRSQIEIVPEDSLSLIKTIGVLRERNCSPPPCFLEVPRVVGLDKKKMAEEHENLIFTPNSGNSLFEGIMKIKDEDVIGNWCYSLMDSAPVKSMPFERRKSMLASSLTKDLYGAEQLLKAQANYFEYDELEANSATL